MGSTRALLTLVTTLELDDIPYFEQMINFDNLAKKKVMVVESLAMEVKGMEEVTVDKVVMVATAITDKVVESQSSPTQ